MTPAQRLSPTQIGARTVCVLSLVLGGLIAVWRYWIADVGPNRGCGMVLIYMITTNVVLLVLNLIAFFVTMPLYFRLRLPRDHRRMVIHASVGTLLGSAALYARLSVWLLESFAAFTGKSALLPLLVATFLVSLIPFAASILLQAGWRRLAYREASKSL